MKIKEHLERECAHLPCGCPAYTGSDYCCPWCKKAEESTDCDCGHSDCSAEE